MNEQANDRQVGGTHYKDLIIDPWDYIHKNGIGFLAGSAIKYLSRYKEKDGIKDLQKAIHFIEKLIEEEYGVVIDETKQRIDVIGEEV